MAGLQWLDTASIQVVDINSSNLTEAENCPRNLTDPFHSGWVYLVFGECIINVRRWFAFWIGLSSIVCWVIAQVPQLVKNCRTGKADEALSFWFLLQWLLGDTTNLIGAILTHQLATQIVTAVYFVIIDGLAMSQFIYYVVKNQGVKGLLNCWKCTKPRPEVAVSLLPGVAFTLLLASSSPGLWGDPYQSGPRSGRTLKHIDYNFLSIHDARDVTGYVLGCISAIFYVCSRVPQIVKNCRRCSVEGLSPIMFVLAIMGNATYGLGIFLYSVEPVFLLQKLPWLVGSVGTLVFDFIIVIQFLMSLCNKYGHRLCWYIRKGGDREPLLDTASSASDNEHTRERMLREEHVFNRSLSPEAGLSRYKKSVQ